MSKSARLRLDDLRALYELGGECRDLGDDPRCWREHFAGRVGTWIGAGVVIVFELGMGQPGGKPEPFEWTGIATWGFETSGMSRPGWERVMEAASRHGVAINPMSGAYHAAASREDGVALTRADLVSDAEFCRSEYYREYQVPTGADAQMNCFRSIPGTPGGTMGVVPVRPAGESDFALRHRALVREAVALVVGLHGGPLARFDEPSPGNLSPRQRQVLRCLLEGDGDKQVAVRLGISRLTVNVHTKAIFRHFGVQGRAELLARWVRRGWGSKCAWADDGR